MSAAPSGATNWSALTGRPIKRTPGTNVPTTQNGADNTTTRTMNVAGDRLRIFLTLTQSAHDVAL